MIQVPDKFRPHIRVDYPPNNKLIFEEWFYHNHHGEQTAREYLPIFWTSYYVNNSYGQDQSAMQALQIYIDSLDRSKQYFTILQYDDGILNDVSGIDLKIFGSGSIKTSYPLPLLTMKHPYTFSGEKKHFANFMCAINHPIRRKIQDMNLGYYNPGTVPIEEYCKTLSESFFTLCPRGYGVTSFRLMEALQYGSIPVYISDMFINPHDLDFNQYGINIFSHNLDRMDGYLRSLSMESIAQKVAVGKKVFEDYYTYEANRKIILANA